MAFYANIVLDPETTAIPNFLKIVTIANETQFKLEPQLLDH